MLPAGIGSKPALPPASLSQARIGRLSHSIETHLVRLAPAYLLGVSLRQQNCNTYGRIVETFVKGLTIMALKKLRMICAGGDKTLAEWDTETVTPQRLAEIEKEFNEKMAQGWFAADISDKRDVLIREFNPKAEILLIPRVQGGL